MGVVQGLTEFLPVSSSAHLILVRDVLGWDAGETELVFDVVCHLGTLIAVIVYFWRDLVQLIVAVPRVALAERDEATQLGRLIVVATLPVVLVGVFFAELIAPFRTPVVATVTLALGGALMLVADRVGAKRRKSSAMSFVEATWLGVAQAAALLPGVSRSGAVLTLSLFYGLTRKEAARFAFLLGVPAILGAGLRAAWSVGWDEIGDERLVLVVGFLVSGGIGYLAVAGLLRYLNSHSLAVFAYYRLVVAAVLALRLSAM